MQSESPVPVFACWNGIVVFRADPLLPIHLRSNHTLSNDPLPYALSATHPAAKDPSLLGPSPALTPPIRFRASVLGECFSSESFLLPYDLRRVFNMQRILLNSRVIVAYEWRYVTCPNLSLSLPDVVLQLFFAGDARFLKLNSKLGCMIGFTCISSGS